MSNKKSSFLSKFGHAFDLWLIPQGNKPVKRLRVERWHWMVGMGVGGGFLLTLVGTAFLTSAGYWYYQSAYWKLKNQSQMMEVYEKEKVEYVKKLALLEKSVQDAQKMTTQLASLVGQEKIPLKAGIGPINMHPGDKRLEAAALKFDLEIEKPLTFDRFSALDKNLNRVGEASVLLQEKLKELTKIQEKKLYLTAATPSLWPVKGWVTSDFGYRLSPFNMSRDFHPGLDIAAQWGTPVSATAAGVVVQAKYRSGYGNTVIIDHGFGLKSMYAHASSLLVKEGQRVAKGDKLALVGTTGHSTGPHLHFEVHVDGVPVDPMKYIQ